MFRGSALVLLKSSWNLELAQRQGGVLLGYSCLRELSLGKCRVRWGSKGLENGFSCANSTGVSLARKSYDRLVLRKRSRTDDDRDGGVHGLPHNLRHEVEQSLTAHPLCRPFVRQVSRHQLDQQNLPILVLL